MRNQKSARKEQPSNRRLSLYKLFRPFCDIFKMPKSIFNSMTYPRFPPKIQLNDHEICFRGNQRLKEAIGLALDLGLIFGVIRKI